MSVVALVIGYIAIGALASAFAFLAFLWIAARWPFMFMGSRSLPTNIDTPRGSFPINLMFGLQSSRKVRWFFGLMILQPIPGEPRRARVVHSKTPPPNGED